MERPRVHSDPAENGRNIREVAGPHNPQMGCLFGGFDWSTIKVQRGLLRVNPGELLGLLLRGI